jgi:redox-sensitive bicupin YhaK (pirin superfamily)
LLTILKAQDRSNVLHRKQQAYTTFDFENRTRPHAEGFSSLETFHENLLLPGAGLTWKNCKESEIVTYVSKGVLTQKDRAGRLQTLSAGEFQSLSATLLDGRSEKNSSKSEPLHLFRMALRPLESEPNEVCGKKYLSTSERRERLRVAVSRDGRDGSLHTHSDVLILTAVLPIGRHLVYPLSQDRKAWLHIVRGEAALFDLTLTTGDGAAVWFEPAVSLTAVEETEILLMDVKPDVDSTANVDMLGRF